ncbi:MAG: hypothetical protein WBD48_02080 [Pseudolabrys sp.]
MAAVIFSLKLGAAISAPELGEQAGNLGIADGGRRPVDVDDGDFAGREIAREFAQADIDHANLGSQQFVRFRLGLLRHAPPSLNTGHNNAGWLANGHRSVTKTITTAISYINRIFEIIGKVRIAGYIAGGPSQVECAMRAA